MDVIQFKNVYFSYETGEDERGEDFFGSNSAFAVNGVDFSVQEGEFVAILGHNGSGKSTLARLTDGLLKSQRIQVGFNEKAIKGLVKEGYSPVYCHVISFSDIPCLGLLCVHKWACSF